MTAPAGFTRVPEGRSVRGDMVWRGSVNGKTVEVFVREETGGGLGLMTGSRWVAAWYSPDVGGELGERERIGEFAQREAAVEAAVDWMRTH